MLSIGTSMVGDERKKIKMGKFYMGLDIGTDSCGFACTDENYKLMRLKGKDAWGARLFSEADTAKGRRVFRSTRRREARRRQRCMLLEEIFAPELNKKDPAFILRLHNSRLFLEDKDEELKEQKYTLFNDPNFVDKGFYKRFPTIFHLRKALMEGDAYALSDIRFVYLAVHHIIKYRGNFIKEGQSFSKGFSDDADAVNAFMDIQRKYDELSEEEDIDVKIISSEADAKKVADILLKSRLVGEATRELTAQGLVPKEKENKAIFLGLVALIMGGKKAASLFAPSLNIEKDDDVSFSFNTADYDDAVEPIIEDLLGNYIDVIALAKSVYDWKTLNSILGDESSLSCAMVKTYEKHKTDLKKLKELLKHDEKLYRSFFYLHGGEDGKHIDKEQNYCFYVGHGCIRGKKVYNVRKCSREDFLKELKGLLTKNESILSIYPTYSSILQEVVDGEFLPTCFSKSSSVIPYQIHEYELKLILQHVVKAYPSFGKKGSDGLTDEEKIRKLLTFRVPYYVGPLVGDKSQFGWAKKKKDAKITPWNFDEVIDRKASARAFIDNLTSYCTYLRGKTVLAANSLAYSEYMVLNELNNVKINGERITQDMKLSIFNDLFMTRKKVTVSSIINNFAKKGQHLKKEDIVLSNREEEFDSSLSSYLDFVRIFGSKQAVEDNKEFVERAIFLSTIYGDPKMAKETLKDEYAGKVDGQIIEKASKLVYKGWGKFSKEFLLGGVYYADDAGIVHNILSLLLDTNKNLNEILFDGRYGFQSSINEYNKVDTDTKEIDYQDVKDLYCSPSVKRGIWQSLKVARELVKVAKRDPDKIYVEVTRERLDDNKRKKTASRKDQLLALYHACEKDAESFANIKHLEEQLQLADNNALRGDALFLYYSQLGKDMYDGSPIDIDDISSKYDIDHIIPQAMKKDDSLSNRCLVNKDVNQKVKKAQYPLPHSIQDKMRPFWSMLFSKGLMSKEKFASLTRTSSITNDELASFIERQLVETNQTCAAVISFLKEMYPNAKVEFSKAKNVSAFRQKYGLLKVRAINDLHHANDAYLNIVVGNTLISKYGHDYKSHVSHYSSDFTTGSNDVMKVFDNDVPGAWTYKGGLSIETVKKTLHRKTPLITRMTTYGKGSFYEMNLVNRNEALVKMTDNPNNPLSDEKKYGGYSSARTAYFRAIEMDEKGKTVTKLVAIPVLFAQKCKKDDGCSEYLKSIGYENFTISKKVGLIPMKTHIKYKGCDALISGTSNGRIIISLAVEPFYDDDDAAYIRTLSKYWEKIKADRVDVKNLKDSNEIIAVGNQDHKNEVLITKARNSLLLEMFARKLKSKCYNALGVVSSQSSLIENNIPVFAGLTIYQQIYVLLELVDLLCSAKGAVDFSLINGSKNACFLTISSDLSNNAIISESTCGLFVKETRL